MISPTKEIQDSVIKREKIEGMSLVKSKLSAFTYIENNSSDVVSSLIETKEKL
jgi:hypothetical protein